MLSVICSKVTVCRARIKYGCLLFPISNHVITFSHLQPAHSSFPMLAGIILQPINIEKTFEHSARETDIIILTSFPNPLAK